MNKTTKMRLGLLIILIAGTFNGFTQEYFNERFGFSNSLAPDGALNAIEVNNGYVLNGKTEVELTQSKSTLGMIKFSLEGEILWEKTWGDTISHWWYSGRGSLINHLNAYYTIGSKTTFYETENHSETLLIKYNDDFDTLWTAYYGKKQFPYDSSYIARNFTGIENGFVVVGTLELNYRANHEVYLLKMDSLGNVLWEHNYQKNGFHTQGMSIINTSDNGFAIGAYRWVTGPYGVPIGDPIVIKTDSLGNLEWELNLGGQYQDGTAILCQSDDGNIFATSRFDTDSIHELLYDSRVQLAKIDNLGNILWNYLYGDNVSFQKVQNIRTVSKNGVIISGSHWHPTPNEMGFMLRVDSLGDSLWYRQYAILNGPDSRNILYDAIPTSDGGFLGAGGCSPIPPDTGNQDAWVIKIDSMGCTSISDCWVGEPEWKWITTEGGNKIKIYPNPANTWFEVEIKTNNKKDNNLIIKVFDLYGCLIEEMEIPKGQNSTRLYVSDWNKGVYLIRVKDNNVVVGSGKVIVR